MPASGSGTTDAPPTFSVILATLNERENLPEVLDRLFRLPRGDFEVVVVDDGSTDGTRELVRDRARTEGRLRLLTHEGKQTTVRAQCQGIEVARGPLVVIMDADLQHPPERIADLVARLEQGASLAVASRYAHGGTPGPRSRTRWFYSRGAEWIAKAWLREARAVSDPVSGFFAFRREIFVPLGPGYRGYKLLLFTLVMNRGRPVAEVGYRFEPRAHGASKATQGYRFIPLFLRETLLAGRLRRTLGPLGPPRETPIASRT
ncbi:MAG TPA: glycosyltransferase [Thermoplasmata archaeon]|nr:glycosyltransferase [Thermoplasmata archaeon]